LKNAGYQRKCLRCTSLLLLCTSCDRRHWYCSELCKTQARRDSWRASSHKYRRTSFGRYSNRQAQARHRAKKRLNKIVSQQSSERPPLESKIFGEPGGRAELSYHGQEEPPHVEQLKNATQSPAEEKPDKAITVSRDQPQSRPPVLLNPFDIKQFNTLGACRVCRRAITHIITADVMGKPRQQRGPPCSQMR
jgi:hypothetical protein